MLKIYNELPYSLVQSFLEGWVNYQFCINTAMSSSLLRAIVLLRLIIKYVTCEIVNTEFYKTKNSIFICKPIFMKLSLNANIMKMQIFYKRKFDLKAHWSSYKATFMLCRSKLRDSPPPTTLSLFFTPSDLITTFTSVLLSFILFDIII